MKEKKRYIRYSVPVKLLILAVLIASTIVTGVCFSWMGLGMVNGMTLKEVLHPVSYEDSERIAEYIISEADLQFLRMSDNKMTKVEEDGEYVAYLLPSKQKTNLMFYVKDLNSDLVYTNQKQWLGMNLNDVRGDYEKSVTNAASVSYSVEMDAEDWDEKSTLNPVAEQEVINWSMNTAWNTLLQKNDNNTDYAVFLGINTKYPVKNSIACAKHDFYQDYYYGSAYSWYYLGFPALAVMICMLVLIGCQAGHNSSDRNIHMNVWDRFPFEIWIVVDVILICSGIALAGEGVTSSIGRAIWWTGSDYAVNVKSSFAETALFASCGLLFCVLTVAKMLNLYGRRIKARQLGGSLVVGIRKTFMKWLREIFHSRKESQKLIIRYIMVVALNVVMLLFTILLGYEGLPGLAFLFVIVWIVGDVYMLYRLMKNDQGRDAIKAGLAEISQGNLDYHIDTADMSSENREMAEEVNRMRDGLKRAVESQLKSERLKTELIANVSHDIKTPLTSIINYVDILEREHFQDPRIAGYVDILVRKSARLKQLTDDLIEVSKISSGNITLDMQEINLKQLIKQTNGEFEEKFEARHLQLICNLPQEQLLIRADGRRMYRVLENLYNNVAKYAMPYSRVYVTGESHDGIVTLCIKNMSENPLNISSDELMERFVRGDASRTTEGSGLGLEIARNLTVMQKGSFELYLDGDLFKVVLVFGLPESEPVTENVVTDSANRKKAKKERKQMKLPKLPKVKVHFKNPIAIEKVETGEPVSQKEETK